MEATTDPQAGSRQYLHAATALNLRSWLVFPRFLILSGRVVRAMKGMPGVVASEQRAEFGKRRFLTLSVWENRAALAGLMSSPEHKEASRWFERLGAPGSVTTHWTSESPAPDWAEAERRLAEAALDNPLDRRLARAKTQATARS